jgi:hypothetical protein
MPLNGTQLQVSLSGVLSSLLDLGTVSFPTSLIRGSNYDPGTGAGQVDRIWTDTRTLTASSAEDLDLAGVLTDAFGAVLTFARIKGLLIAASPANTNEVLVGGVASGLATILTPAATGVAHVRPGGFMAFGVGSGDATGYVVTATTADLLHVANGGAGTSVTYDVAIIGCSA